MAKKVVGFELEERTYDRLKVVAVSQGKTVREILTTFIEDYITQAEKEDLIEKLRAIPPEDRLDLIHKINDEERQEEQKEEEKPTRKRVRRT